MASIGDLNNLTTKAKENLVAAINEAAASGGGGINANTLQEAINAALAQAKASGEFDGEDGAPGKTAYEYAKDGGYTGTEEEFAELMANSSKAVQPDLNQNDPTKPDYVKNRTHWMESGAKLVDIPQFEMSNTSREGYVRASGRDLIPMDWVEGNIYNVVWNGVSYRCECQKYEWANQLGQTGRDFILGNLNYLGYDTGLPNLGVDVPFVLFYTVYDTGGSYSHGAITPGNEPMVVSLEIYSEPVYHTLDERFIPGTIARTKDTLPLPPAATVGQFIRVAAVDESGKVTATEAVTMADAEGVGF
jgi:hypothetical protein